MSLGHYRLSVLGLKLGLGLKRGLGVEAFRVVRIEDMMQQAHCALVLEQQRFPETFEK